MKNVLSTLVKASSLAAGLTFAVSGFSSAEAAFFTVSTTPFTGSNAKVDFLVEDIAGGVKMTASVDTSVNYADIGALWFNLSDNSLFNNLTINGANITAIDQDGNVNAVGSGNNNLNGGGSPAPMEVGIAFGQPGGAGGLITSTMFNVLGTGVSVDTFLDKLLPLAFNL